MPQNDFLAWAIATGANVMPQAAYASPTANPALQFGVGTGLADPTLANKTWRQSSVISSMIAQFIVNLDGVDVFDDGNLSGLLTNFVNALTAHLQIHTQTNVQSYSTHGSFSFTVPSGVFRLYVPGLVGAGGGGGGGQGSATWSSGGGASGGFSSGYITVTPGQIIPVTVGQGGAGGLNTNGAVGGTGGSTSFGAFISATGGTGGVGGTSTAAGGTPGIGSGGSIFNFSGSNGADGNPGLATVQGGQGGASAFGGGGRTATFNISAMNGLAPGSGGGGIWNTGLGAQVGGIGADGALFVVWSA
jgi:hypothetical protein